MIVIEMNPRVSRSSALASKATGFPIAKIAAEARARLPPRRNSQRHHAPHARQLRADDRLRRRQDSAVELREVPAGRSHADDADEVGWRGDGDRTHLQGSVHEGRAVARARTQRTAVRHERRQDRRDCRGGETTTPRCASGSPSRTIAGCGMCSARSSADGRRSRCTSCTKIDPWFLRQFADIVELRREAQKAGGLEGIDARFAAPPQARRLRRSGARAGVRHHGKGRQRQARGARAQAGLQARRHVRGGVRIVHAVSCTARTSRRAKSNPNAREQGRHPRQRAEPHRAGHRVRLLLLPCRVRAARRGLRDDHGELQPGNRVDRLRHGGPVVFPAADVRRRHGRSSRRSARRAATCRAWCSSAARRRSSSRSRCSARA